MMDVPEAVAVPWVAWVATATISGAPPVMFSVIGFAVLPCATVALTAFAAIFTVTAGGPGTATEILNLYAYRKSFTELSIGYGSALAVALLIVTIIISGILFALRRPK